jgi:dipeptidyl aminopeptidase/acylaminoacyl peptidase
LKSAPAACAARSSGVVAFVGQDFHQPNAVYRCDPASGETAVVAQPALPEGWPSAPLPRAEVIRWRAADNTEIEGILVYPFGYTGGRRVPLIVEVHGGPPGVYTRGYLAAPERLADTVALAARGCAVLRANPRGSSGYGRAFRFANYGDWGGGDFQDILAGVDVLIARGVADPERLGLLGWSYGGYLTASGITQTTRFKAAVVGAGITNLVSFNGTADIPDFVPDYLGGELWDDPESYRRRSPVMNAAAIATPTLILHGEADVRVPASQGRELYNALKRRGVPTMLVLYPREGHLIGEPRHLLDRSRRVIEWFERWILT